MPRQREVDVDIAGVVVVAAMGVGVVRVAMGTFRMGTGSYGSRVGRG